MKVMISVGSDYILVKGKVSLSVYVPIYLFTSVDVPIYLYDIQQVKEYRSPSSVSREGKKKGGGSREGWQLGGVKRGVTVAALKATNYALKNTDYSYTDAPHLLVAKPQIPFTVTGWGR